jgi:uncharacterized protein (TIGR00730 family)
VNVSFKKEAAVLGQYIADECHTLVYGGSIGGLMDSVAHAVKDGGGEIIGIIPELIAEKGRESDLPDQLFSVSDMSERKDLMKEYADVFVVLPGGYGTIDEMFDAISCNIVGYIDKPIVMVNTENYWEGILMQIKRMELEHIAQEKTNSGVIIADNADEAVEILKKLNERIQ